MRVSALASTCTSVLLAAVALAGGAPPDPGTVATLEIEARLVRKPDLYLVVRAPERRLEIKARGVLLDWVPLSGVEVVSPRPVLGQPSPSRLEVPAVLTVKDGPGDLARVVIAPEELRRMPSDEEEEAEADASLPPTTPTPVPEAPFSYRAELDNGWDVWICEELPGAGLFSRLRNAAFDGWARLWSRAENHRPALTLAMSREDAQRIFHLFNTDRIILIAAGP